MERLRRPLGEGERVLSQKRMGESLCGIRDGVLSQRRKERKGWEWDCKRLFYKYLCVLGDLGEKI